MSADSVSSHVLVPHPASPPTVAVRIGVSVAAAGDGRLALHYHLEGDTNSVRWPAARPGQRIDGLWRHTCFEAFLVAPSGEYLEYNFAPSGAWAAYHFSAYRAAMRPLLNANAPNLKGLIARGTLAYFCVRCHASVGTSLGEISKTTDGAATWSEWIAGSRGMPGAERGNRENRNRQRRLIACSRSPRVPAARNAWGS
jgi:hypothetical protein